MRVRPNISHLSLNIPESDVLTKQTANDVSYVKMGIAEKSLWGKKFKIRVVSKNSGKKMDVDFKFVQEYTKPTDEVV